LKFKLILVTVLALGSMAHAQGFLSNFSVSAGFEGIFPAATFTKSSAEASLNANTQVTTYSVGAVGGVRYDFGRHSAFDFAYTYNRNSELFFPTSASGFSSGYLERVKSNDSEFIGTYVVRLPSNERLKPYALVGGGMVYFSPVSNGFNTGITPSTQTKPAFAYGFGNDFKLTDHFFIRLQYRGLVRGEPDFKLITAGPFGTGLKTHVPEPSIQVVYHF
jgi:opacity protein-like surface antigen